VSDVSATALQFADGTSFVAPQLAGVFALINQSTDSQLSVFNSFGTSVSTTGYSGAGLSNGQSVAITPQ
jgi:subtilase family serine protease